MLLLKIKGRGKWPESEKTRIDRRENRIMERRREESKGNEVKSVIDDQLKKESIFNIIEDHREWRVSTRSSPVPSFLSLMKLQLAITHSLMNK